MPKVKSIAGTVDDPTVEFVPLEIDGKTYQLAYDFWAIAQAEKIAGCNLLHGLAALLIAGPSASEIVGLLYAGLRKAHPKMTIEQAARLVRVDTLEDITGALVRAYNASLPEAKKILADPTAAATEGGRSSPTENSGSNATPLPESPSG